MEKGHRKKSERGDFVTENVESKWVEQTLDPNHLEIPQKSKIKQGITKYKVTTNKQSNNKPIRPQVRELNSPPYSKKKKVYYALPHKFSHKLYLLKDLKLFVQWNINVIIRVDFWYNNVIFNPTFLEYLIGG